MTCYHFIVYQIKYFFLNLNEETSLSANPNCMALLPPYIVTPTARRDLNKLSAREQLYQMNGVI